MNNINWQNELALGSGEIFEPEPQEESDAEMDLRISGPTFAESQARLARVLNRFTELLGPHVEQRDETN